MIRITVGCNLMREIFFFVCVRWTSGTEAAAAVFGSWQTAGTADISFILKGKKKHVPTNNHKGTTLTFHIGGTMQHILYRILVVLTTLHQLQSNMFTVFIMLLLEKPKLWHTWWCTVFDLWDMKPKTKNCQTFVSGWGGYGECVISSELLQPQRTACSRQIQPQTRGKSYSMSHVQIIVWTRFVKMMMIKESKSPSDCLHKNCNTFC